MQHCRIFKRIAMVVLTNAVLETEACATTSLGTITSVIPWKSNEHEYPCQAQNYQFIV